MIMLVMIGSDMDCIICVQGDMFAFSCLLEYSLIDFGNFAQQMKQRVIFLQNEFVI